jgi:hypothetical protein
VIDTQTSTCLICLRALYADEAGRYCCRPCQDHGTIMLRAMPDLYTQLGELLQPGAGRGEGRVSGSKSAPLPCSTDALDLRSRGGIVTVLASWEDAVRDELGYTAATFRGDYEQTLTGVIGFLVGNAPWIYSSFAAVDEMHREVRRLHGHAASLTEGERPARRVPVTCTCGWTLRVTLDTAGVKCPGCSTQYGHSEVLRLPLAERRAA